jgi:hypothetical protein
LGKNPSILRKLSHDQIPTQGVSSDAQLPLKSHPLAVGVETLHELSSKHMPVRSELVHQIFKYSVLELSASEQPVVANLILLSTEHSSGFLPREAVTAGIRHTIKGLDELKLDNPMAQKYLAQIVSCLAEAGLVEADLGGLGE